jgi:DNA-directed RNA polymerase specialized sigma24 family protein
MNQTQRLLRLAQTWAESSPGQEIRRATYRTLPRLKSDEVQELVAGYVAGATVFRNHVPMRMVGLTTEQVDEAVRLYEVGWSAGRIGERMRVDARTVHRRLKEQSVMMRDTHGRER